MLMKILILSTFRKKSQKKSEKKNRKFFRREKKYFLSWDFFRIFFQSQLLNQENRFKAVSERFRTLKGSKIRLWNRQSRANPMKFPESSALTRCAA